MEPSIVQYTELIKEAIKNRNYLKWVAFALKLMHKFDHEYALEANDLVSEIIVKVITGKRKWNNEIDLDTFMYRNIQSYFYNYIRKQHRIVYDSKTQNEKNNADTMIETLNKKSADYIIDRYDLDNITEQCYRKLNYEEKRVFIELNNGLSPVEIGNRLGISRFNVYYLRRRIQKKIGGLLK
jgi:RNA polymerase sigma factor (sigma-70 family)